jgi:Secretion system C-terminal sorting domain
MLSTDLDELGLHNISIYPQPAGDQVQLSGMQGWIEIWDATGRKIETLYHNASSPIMVSTQDWADGIYLVRNGSEVEKLMIRH